MVQFTNAKSFAVILEKKGNIEAFMQLHRKPLLASQFINNPKDGTIQRFEYLGIIKEHEKCPDKKIKWKSGPNYKFLYDYLQRKYGEK